MAGAGYKLFNTGDVLTAAQVNTYLMEQTVMVFANAAARTTALSGVVSEGMISYLKDTNAVEVYDGSNWVSSDDPNAIQNTIVDAKGDLITATASDVPARLAVGNNGETLVADSSASNGLRWQPPVNSNPLINSAMQIWQRGTSFTITSGAGNVYTADRWIAYRGATGSTVSRQTTSDSTNLPFIQYCARVQRDSGNTSTSSIVFAQNIETANSIPLAGRTITMSFYARAGANFSATSSLLAVQLVQGFGTDQNVITGFTSSNAIINSSATLTTTWQRFTFTATLSSTVTQLAPYIYYTPAGTAGAADFFEITGVQIEVGSVATQFRTNAATLAGELLAAQRYYIAFGGDSFESFGVGQCTSTTKAVIHTSFPVQMRTAPTFALTGNNALTNSSGGTVVTTGSASDRMATKTAAYEITVASGLTAGNATRLVANNDTSARLTFSAEL